MLRQIHDLRLPRRVFGAAHSLLRIMTGALFIRAIVPVEDIRANTQRPN